MDDATQKLIDEARKAQRAVYLATEKDVADDLARIIGGLADALEACQPAPMDSDGHSHTWTNNPLIRDHFCIGCGERKPAPTEGEARPSLVVRGEEELREALEPLVWLYDAPDIASELIASGDVQVADATPEQAWREGFEAHRRTEQRARRVGEPWVFERNPYEGFTRKEQNDGE